MSIELGGGGVHALRALAQRAGDATLGDDNGASSVLSTAQLRHAATLLRRLRSDDPTTPTLAALFKQSGGVTVHLQSDNHDSDASTASSEEHALYIERRRKKLLRLDEEMRYGRLVRNVKSKTSAHELEQFQKSTRQHLSIGANMIAARVTAFIAMYMLGRTLTDNETSRVIIGLGGAIVMMVIEMVLFITRASKYEAIEREQQQQRPKSVLEHLPALSRSVGPMSSSPTVVALTPITLQSPELCPVSPLTLVSSPLVGYSWQKLQETIERESHGMFDDDHGGHVDESGDDGRAVASDTNDRDGNDSAAEDIAELKTDATEDNDSIDSARRDEKTPDELDESAKSSSFSMLISAVLC